MKLAMYQRIEGMRTVREDGQTLQDVCGSGRYKASLG